MYNKTTIRFIHPCLLISLPVVVFWRVLTMADNYDWSSTPAEGALIRKALRFIFLFKTIFWLVIVNSAVFLYRLLMKDRYKIAAIIFTLLFPFYFFVGAMVNKQCAQHYYTIFTNQSVVEWAIDRPILEAGYSIGPILTKEVSNKEMVNRRYAIDGLQKLKYTPATVTLTKILLDKSEEDYIRADAYEALTVFATTETKKVLADFKNQAKDSLDKRVIELGEFFMHNK